MIQRLSSFLVKIYSEQQDTPQWAKTRKSTEFPEGTQKCMYIEKNLSAFLRSIAMPKKNDESFLPDQEFKQRIQTPPHPSSRRSLQPA